MAKPPSAHRKLTYGLPLTVRLFKEDVKRESMRTVPSKEKRILLRKKRRKGQ